MVEKLFGWFVHIRYIQITFSQFKRGLLFVFLLAKRTQITPRAIEKHHAWLYFTQPRLFSMAIWRFCECQRRGMWFKSPSWRMKPT